MSREPRRTRRARRKGATMALLAVFMVVVVAMAAFAIDCGMIVLVRTQLQCAADAAALAGAASLSGGSSAVQTAAQSVAAANTVAGQPVTISTSNIVLGTWSTSNLTFTPLAGAAQSGANAVQVNCYLTAANGNAMTLFFGRIFNRNSTDVQAKSIAMATTVRCGPFIGLTGVQMSGSAYTDSYNSNNGPYSAGSAGNSDDVCSNGNIQSSSSGAIHGDAHPGPGYSYGGGGPVTGSQTPLTQDLSEAAVNFGNVATVNNNANIPLSAQNKQPLDNSRNFSLSGSDNVSLPPGTYYFAKFSLSGSSYVTITGATSIYCTDQVQLSGSGIMNTASLPANCKIYCSGNQVQLSGSSAMYGVVYAPSAQVQLSGSAPFYGSIVGSSLSLSGSAGLHYDQALASESGNGSQFPQLVQ